MQKSFSNAQGFSKLRCSSRKTLPKASIEEFNRSHSFMGVLQMLFLRLVLYVGWGVLLAELAACTAFWRVRLQETVVGILPTRPD
eukprot:3063769-Amphidinium_carterae.1